MDKKPKNIDERLDRLEVLLERMALSIIKGFEKTDNKIESTEVNLKTQIDIYARAVDAYAKQ